MVFCPCRACLFEQSICDFQTHYHPRRSQKVQLHSANHPSYNRGAARGSRWETPQFYICTRAQLVAGNSPIRKGHIHHAPHFSNLWAALAVQECSSHESRLRLKRRLPSPCAIDVKIGDVMHESKDV